MLVGAPKGENLQPNTTRSGALYRCPLTTHTTDCQQVQTDGHKNSNGLYKGNPDGTLMGPTDDEIKDDQWMGVTLKSQGEGGGILVCGHRYQHKGTGASTSFRRGYGLCYYLTNNFDYEENYQPCVGKPVSREQEQFSVCQAGTSGLVLEDEVLIGIPGTYTWRGTILTRNISDNYLFRDKTQYLGVYTDEDSPVDKYSYLGYSVTAGKFFGDKMSYVAGAPRSRGTGQVIFFSRTRMGNPSMEYDLILNGETFASSFGFEVLAMDTNKDGHDDLIVSAPFYFTKQTSGAVYVYLNDGNGISNETPFTRLEGAPGESRFGFSMTSLGDINLDGYNDLAIGAPYENKGAIYIYLGSKDGISKEPAQVIRAEDLPGLTYEAFGYALSGGMDLDNNNYNDLLTSSFCSDRVILLRARPIIDIQTRVDSDNLQNINPTKPGCAEDENSEETCFSFSACFKMMNEAGTQTFLSLQYNISERYYNDQPSYRIKFHRSHPAKPSTVEQVVYLQPSDMGKFQCSREIVYLRSDQKDVLRPVRFKLSYKIHQKDPRPVEEGEELPDIDEYPILNQQEAVRYFEATFAKDCGEDDICDNDLRIEGELDLEKHPTEDHYIFELGKRPFFNLTTTITNEEDPAYLPNLYVRHDKAIDLSLRESETSPYQCAPVTSRSGLLNCELGNPLVNTTGPLNLVFKPSGLPFKGRMIELDAWVNSTSKELNPQDNRISFLLEVKRRAEISITGSAEPEQTFYSGEVIGESAIKTVNEVGTAVTHKYLVDNRGPWKVDEMKVRISWPRQTENNKKEGKWLLYLTGIPFVEGDGECDVDPAYINSLGYDELFITPEAEADTDRLTGVTPPSVSTGTTFSTTKITKTTSKKKVISSSTKKSWSAKEKSEREYEEEDAYGRGGSRTYNRVSRKVYSSGDRNKVRIGDKERDDLEYENYDSFFLDKEKGKDEDRRGGPVDSSGVGYTRHETTHTRRVYTTDSDSSGRKFLSKSDRLNAVENIRAVEEGGESYLNGYDKNGVLVWTSRAGFSTEGDADRTRTELTGSAGDMEGSHSETAATRRKFELRREEELNSHLLSQRMAAIVDFRIIREGERTWVNGYDENGQVVWSSRSRHYLPSGQTDGDGRYESSVKTEFSYRESTRDEDGDGVGETRKSWSTSVTDKDGTRRRNGSSVSETKDWDLGNRDNWDSRTRNNVDRSGSHHSEGHEARTSYSSGGRSSTGYDHGERTSLPDDGSGSSSFYKKKYSYHERTRDEDGDGVGETRKAWSSSVTDNDGTEHHSGSSITDEHGTRILSGSAPPPEDERSGAFHDRRRTYTSGDRESSQYGSSRSSSSSGGHSTYESHRSSGSSRDNGHLSNTYIDEDGKTRYRFDWNYPEGRDGDRAHSNHHDTNDRTGTDEYNRRWGQSSGFRNKHQELDHPDPQGTSEDGNYQYSSHRSSHHESSRSYQPQNDEPLHGFTYSRAVVDKDTGNVEVYSQKVFRRKSGDQWQEVHGPYKDEEWSTDSHPDGKTLKRSKREREFIIKPEAITDAQTGKTMQVVNFRCDGKVPTAKCITFYCTIRNLAEDQSASIRIPARLWNSTLVEDYSRVNYVSIKSTGELILPDEIESDQDTTDDVDYAETLAYPNLLEQLPPEKVPLWVILVSVLAGILLLVLIAIVLWKLGFFKRRRPDPTLSGNIDRDVNGYN